ncbi:MAG: ATP-binding cassette domain-containing protein [Planctomycetota bacterium]|nr:MAG: ATP-binding cassette domain-containing protein [Planctomycetota bacterium]
MLRLTGIRKQYGATVALRGVDLDIASGRTTVLIGPSGCGKSTLLRLMNGLIEPDAGVVAFGGEPLTRRTVRRTRHRIGYVIQDGGLFPHLTARGNVTLLATVLGWPHDRLSQRVDELCELTHFPRDGLDRYPAQLSGGQQQRVALMRALMLDPPVLLLDEPLGALDPIIRRSLQEELRDIFRTLKKTVVLVTHDLAEAGYFGDVIALMRAGEIVQQGPFRELIRSPADDYAREFISAQRGPLDVIEEARS